MSLLMDALRRAETTGTEAQQDDEAQAALTAAIELPASNSPLQLEPLDTSATVIPGGDSSVVEQQQPEPPATVETAAEPAPSPQQAQSAVQALTGRKSTALKHLVFVSTGMLTAGVILAGYYFWQRETTNFYQVAPAATLIDIPPQTEIISAGHPAETVTPADKSTPAIPDLPPEPAGSHQDTSTAPVSTPAPATGQQAPIPPKQRIDIHRTHASSGVPVTLQRAYKAYQQGAYTQAEQLYRQTLQSYPGNRDAMLGLAAIALHDGNRRTARYYYERLVKADPADKTALLALQGLSGGQYSLENGSKLKYWLQTDQDNAQLHFALGNQYAASAQWKEAQQSYFEAYSLAPGNADYAFNLAVSLDQLGHGKQALDFYRQAQQLANNSGALFSTSQLENRIHQLQNVEATGQ